MHLVGGLVPARISLVRCKNKVRDHDPTHFRNLLNNALIEFDGRTAFAELQVHHAAVLEYNESAHAHIYYDYFRRYCPPPTLLPPSSHPRTL